MPYLILIFILILIFLGLAMIPDIARRHPFAAFLVTALMLLLVFLLAIKAVEILL